MKILSALALLFVLTPALAEPPALELSLDGAVKTPLHLSEAALRALPVTDLTVQWPLGSHLQPGPYKGVLLMSLVAQAVTKDEVGKNSYIRHTVLVYGRDGYAAALAEGEFNPAYEGKVVILAYEVDGKPFKDGLRLVVPGDKEGGRQVHDVVRIEVR
jgi:DMSO/TMAO reductase YedYZ molybdopterin-dependent catalytic subunit